MYKAISLTIALLFYSSFRAIPQTNSVTDSLKNIVATTKVDTVKIIALIDLFWEYKYTDLQIAKPFIDEALVCSKKTGYKKGEGSSYNGLGQYYERTGNYKDALLYYFKAASIFDSIHRIRSLSVAYANIAIVYKMTGDYRNAMEYNFKALRLKEKINNKFDIADSYNNIASLYSTMGNHTKSMEYNIQALQLRREIKDNRGIAYSLNNIGDIFRLQLKYNKAIQHYTEALQLLNELGDETGIATTYANIGLTYKELKKFKEAITFMAKALAIASKSDIKERIAYFYQNIGETYYEMGNMEKSFNNYLQCNIEANSIGHMSMQMDSYYYLSKISAKKQKFSDAYQFYTHYVAIKDSITNQDKNNKIAEIEIRYATEKKDNQIILLNERARIQKLELARRNQWVLFISVFALLLFIISVLVYWFRTFKTKQLLLNAILETENAERLRIAKDMHDELGSGFSKIQLFAEVARQNMENPPTLEENIGRISVSAKELADNMRDLIWTMNPENSTLDNLVARLREYCADFLDEFPIDYTLNFQDDIPKTAILQDAQRNIYLTLKEALNNTIKHAQANSIVIALSISGSLLTLNITDDGNGFDMGKIKKNGNGLVNMAERIRKINGTFQLTSNPGKGTDITFTINTNKSS